MNCNINSLNYYFKLYYSISGRTEHKGQWGLFSNYFWQIQYSQGAPRGQIMRGLSPLDLNMFYWDQRFVSSIGNIEKAM